jgi:hypothetical protein
LEIQALLVFAAAFAFACIVHRRAELLATAYDLTGFEAEVRENKDIYGNNDRVFREQGGDKTIGIRTYLRADGEGDLEAVKHILEFDSKGGPIFNSTYNFLKTLLITNGLFFFCWGLIVCSPYISAAMSASESDFTADRPVLSGK